MERSETQQSLRGAALVFASLYLSYALIFRQRYPRSLISASISKGAVASEEPVTLGKKPIR
jgi:hypothetical protein